MNIRIRDLGKHKIMMVEGDVDLYNVGELKMAIFRLIDESEVLSLVIDMSGISYMDSSGIGALVAGQKKIKTKGGKFALMSVREEVLNIFLMASMDQFFTIYENESQIQ